MNISTISHCFISETFPSPDNLKLDSPNPKSIVVQSEDSSKSSAKRNPNIIWVRLYSQYNAVFFMFLKYNVMIIQLTLTVA